MLLPGVLLAAGLVLAGAACLPAQGRSEDSAQDGPVGLAFPPHPGPFTLGVQTHFSQGWPAARLDTAASVKAALLRDGMAWAAAVPRPGLTVFPPAMAAPLDRACAKGMKLLLTVDPVHPAYDGGEIATSPAAQAAFGDYLDKLAGRFGACLAGIEVGNELNGSKVLRRGGNLPARYVALLRTVYPAFKARHPDVALVGGSTNVIGTGFLETLFDAGLLEVVDAVAVHPYRGHAENLGWELARLNRTMAAHGRMVPIWASEFSDTFADPRDAAAALLKMVTLLAGSGVHMASWYALADQKWFPSMGLVTASGQDKPAAAAYRLLTRELLPLGRPVAASRDPLLVLWRYGADRWVLWGAPRPLVLAPGSRVLDAEGRVVPAGQARVSAAPLVVIGPRPTPGETPVLADSLYQFAAAPWSYHAATGGRLVALRPLDTDFTTSLGERTLRPLRLGDAAGAATPAASPVVRYTAPADLAATVLACLAHRGQAGASLRLSLTGPGGPLAQADLARDAVLRADVTLRKGEALDLRFDPGAGARGHTFSYRLRLYRPGSAPASCEPSPAGWR